ncbi:hypothetical protein [Bradymonas sediminis]|uniref:Uncharacterized protein n=1 Tax=Bradymonas sediminis TaxID=1548548 RepID=A0A2Z4FNK9_9DELT|nr:hypothetical protein [Bradymonas sediminis]AWV90278.1 hypothetical protein DN745_13430 [Bradymonas sediminis]TDP75754.1 CARDB protein [Bradymonas sediminis]
MPHSFHPTPRALLKKPIFAGLLLILLSGCGDCGDGTLQGGPTQTQDTGWDVGERKDVSGPEDAGKDATGDATRDAEESDAAVCDPANQCASECCESAELCLRDACVLPGQTCEHNLECANGEICEPSIGRCIPDPGVVCEYRPDTDIFEPSVTLAWNEPSAEELAAFPGSPSNQVMMTPAVIDLNEDGIPEIIFSTFSGGSYNGRGVLRAIDGKTYAPLFNFTEPDKLVSAAASLAVGDIDGDGRVEIVAAAWSADGGQREIIAFDDYTTGWEVMWRTTNNLTVGSGGVALADLDADGQVEVYGSNWVVDARTGALLCRPSDIGASSVNAIAADLDGDGKMEVITQGGAFKFDRASGVCSTYWQFDAASGEVAVGDFGTFTDGQRNFDALDGVPEVVSVSVAASDQVRLHNGQTGGTIWKATMPTTGHPVYSDAQCSNKAGAGAPTVADFNGDSFPQVATAGACYYTVFERDGTLRWKTPVRDFSSRVTGSSVFDFQGDGKAEVVYADECFVRVYDGTGNGDGTTEILFERPHTSGTLRELPVIADVNNNYHANIVAISNDYSTGLSNACSNDWPAFGPPSNAEHGILVFQDVQDRWVATRPVWNQHAYHVTNVCDGRPGSVCPGRPNTVGAIPIGELDNWTQPGLNNYRQNVQGEGLFNAPDLAVTNLATDCDASEGVTFHVTISNLGTRGVPEGTEVALYVTVEGSPEQYLTTLTTTVRLLPGGAETLVYVWENAPDPSGNTITVRAIADADEDGNGQHNECHEDNNELQNQATCACQENTDCNPGEFCASTGECLPMDG